MKFSFKFSNLLGTVYRRGNLVFTNDGNRLISPVGNRISVFDLKNNTSETLPVQSERNIAALALAPNGLLLLASDEEGDLLLISLQNGALLNKFRLRKPVRCISFSPDGRKFAITKEWTVQVYHSPGLTKEFNPFILYRMFTGANDDTTCIDWSSDSRALCVGSKDMNTRVYAVEKLENLGMFSFGGHSDCIIGTFFANKSLDLYTLSRNGQLRVWQSSIALEDLKEKRVPQTKTNKDHDDADETATKRQKEEGSEEELEEMKKVVYKRTAKYNYKDVHGEAQGQIKVTASEYHKRCQLLLCGLSDGAFFLHDMPDFILIHSLSISDTAITSAIFNPQSDWLALGCAQHGQLLVWEWQSETYVLKQQGHFNNMACLAYSSDAQYIATGSDDAKLKVWSTLSGFCFVTFTEHKGGITGVNFIPNKHVVVSASLDGTVRAFDLHRYRNFRTFTLQQPVQFCCLAVDSSGEVVAAGAIDTFDVYVWSMQTGGLLETLSGHEGPVTSLAFSPTETLLASGSWDKTVKLWDVFENKGSKETLRCGHDVTSVGFRPDGLQLAVAQLNAEITFWKVQDAVQVGSISCKHDLGYSRKEGDRITAKKASHGKSVNSLTYSENGNFILAAGRSKYVCIYSVPDQLLVKKFEVTCNMSFEGTEEFLNKRKMTEWGSLALVEEDDDRNIGQQINLPGVKKGDFSSRQFKPEVRVTSVQFSPTGRQWAACSTEGLLLYSLDKNLVFDPFDLTIDLTPENVKIKLSKQEFTTALIMALKLNEQELITEVIEHVPYREIESVASQLKLEYVEKLLDYIGGQLEASKHLQFYLLWVQRLLMLFGFQLKPKSAQIIGTLSLLEQGIKRKLKEVCKLCSDNKYSIEYVLALSKCKPDIKPEDTAQIDELVSSESEEEMDVS